MKITFRLSGPAVIAHVDRLRGPQPVASFLKDCLLRGLQLAGKTPVKVKPVALTRARPEFAQLDLARVSAALQDRDRQNPVRREVARLVGLYAPLIVPRARALKPAGKLSLDVRCPIEKVAADIAFRALRSTVLMQGSATVH